MHSPHKLLAAIVVFTALYLPALYTVQTVNELGNQSAAAILASAGDTGTNSASHTALTEAQIQSITSLLTSFNVDSRTIATVDGVLRNNGPMPMAGGGVPAGATVIGTSTRPTLRLPPPTAACANLQRTLEPGAVDPEVNTVQNFLASQGFVAASSTPGFFGSTTEEALKQWQAAHGIVSSGAASTTGWGVVGPKTRLAIASFCRPMPPTASSTVSGAPSAPPTCTLTADQTTVQAGAQVTLTWTSTNATYASSPSSNHSPNGSVTVTPTANTTYQKTVYGPGGSATCQVTALVTPSSTTTTATSTGTTNTVMVMAEPNLNLAGVAAADVSWPFSAAVTSLTNMLVQLGIGQ